MDSIIFYVCDKSIVGRCFFFFFIFLAASSNNKSKNIHLTSKVEYPVAAALPLPNNIDPAETIRFSPQRSRDVCGAAISLYRDQLSFQNTIDITVDNSKASDPHIDSYDRGCVVSLNSCMQSNVPSPFGGMHKFSHLNMPGGQWEQGSKFTAQDLQASHYTNLRREVREAWNSNFEKGIFQKFSPSINKTNSFNNFSYTNYRNFSLFHKKLNNNKTNENVSNSEINKNSSNKEKLKRAVKEYGSTVIVFHITISLASLGACYALVSR